MSDTILGETRLGTPITFPPSAELLAEFKQEVLAHLEEERLYIAPPWTKNYKSTRASDWFAEMGFQVGTPYPRLREVAPSKAKGGHYSPSAGMARATEGSGNHTKDLAS